MNYAPLPFRLVALAIDSFLLWIVGQIIGPILGEKILSLGPISITASFIAGLLYNWYFWTRNNGQTPGKMLLGLRVVKVGGGKIGDLEAVLRYIGYYINTFLIFIGWLWAIPDAKNQGFHDKIAGTVVVRA